MAALKADIEPALLSWARESIGYSREEAAAKIGAAGGVERLEAWERGEDAPTIPQLRKIAQIYRRPLAVFFLPEPPKDFMALRDRGERPWQKRPPQNPLACDHFSVECMAVLDYVERKGWTFS